MIAVPLYYPTRIFQQAPYLWWNLPVPPRTLICCVPSQPNKECKMAILLCSTSGLGWPHQLWKMTVLNFEPNLLGEKIKIWRSGTHVLLKYQNRSFLYLWDLHLRNYRRHRIPHICSNHKISYRSEPQLLKATEPSKSMDFYMENLDVLKNTIAASWRLN